jgi:serine/threonine protein kinase
MPIPPSAANASAIERLNVALAGRLRVERELGAGGMATVYLANDLRHGRTVALKVFRDEFAQSVGAERFLREIQIAAQLQHPHIVALLDSGEAAGLLYYLMPFVDGETLRAKIRRDGALPIDTALHIARDVADALTHAHRRRVIHRDIKPENILLADGHALVTDFGIARALGSATDTLTQSGFAVGTPAYMAPEQAVGEKEIDARADLYALGCVLHEMLAGVPPYAGPTQQAALVKRFIEPVPMLRTIRADVPEWLEALVAATLASDPALRPNAASDLVVALTQQRTPPNLSVTTPTPDPKCSIAVLPFANMSVDPENEYFSDGIAEDLINALTQFPNLKVIARTSSFSFKGKNVDVREIGRALGVRHVVEGSVRRAGSTLRLTAQLVDATDGSHMWSDRYDRTLADTFAIQDEITAAIRDAVGGKLFPGRAAVGAQTDEETYDLFLRGRGLLLESSTRLAEAHALLSRATQRDPRFVPALVALADSHFFQGIFMRPPREAWGQARTLAQDIVRRDPGSASGERLIGMLLTFADREFEKAEMHLRRALAANPSDGLAHGFLGLVLVVNNKAAEADLHNKRIIALDPLSPFSHMLAANNWAVAGRLTEAEATASAAIEIDPRYPEGYHMRGYTRNYMGKFAEAEADLARVPGLGNRSAWPMVKHSIALAGLGRYDDVRRIRDEILARSRSEFMTPDAIACIHQLLGQNDEAFRWLSRAVEEQALWTGFVGIDPIFAPLRRDPRFQSFCHEHRITVRPLTPSALDHLETPSE